MRFLHGSVLFDLHNVQKCVTQIIYLGPLPTERNTSKINLEQELDVTFHDLIQEEEK